MPIGHFSKCLSGELQYVSKNKFYLQPKARKAWIKLFDEHIKLHGLPQTYLEYMGKMKKAVEHYGRVAKGHKWEVVKARIYEAEANQMLSQEGEKIETTCALISKFMGFPVRANECSVVEFYNYVDIMRTN